MRARVAAFSARVSARISACVRGEADQRVQPARDDLGVGRNAVVGQIVPGRNVEAVDVGGEEGQALVHLRHPQVIAGDEQHIAAEVPRHHGQNVGVEAGGSAGNDAPARPAKPVDEMLHGSRRRS